MEARDRGWMLPMPGLMNASSSPFKYFSIIFYTIGLATLSEKYFSPAGMKGAFSRQS
jgi:hypothetical protein